MTPAVKPRFEYKFRLSVASYFRALNAIRPYCRLDPYAAAAPGGRYFVRSLYYDTPDYDAYFEKMTGVYHRDKFRIRTYGEQPSPDLAVKVERKSRIGYLIYKTVDTVALKDFEAFQETSSWDGRDGDTLGALAYQVVRNRARPTLLVDYHREAFTSLDGRDVRFSFDHDVRYARAQSLFQPGAVFRECYQNSIIFEIKASENDVDWLARVTQEIGLASEPNSKYANAFEHVIDDVRV